MTSDFAIWLSNETEKRGWSFRELARQAGLSSPTVSNVVNQRTQPGLQFCIQVARALRLPPENVLRRAGLLPSLPSPIEEEHEILAILRDQSASTRAALLAMLRGLAGHPHYGVAEPRPGYDLHTELERQLLDEFREMDEDWQRITLEELKARRRIVRVIGAEEEGGEDSADAQTEQADAA